MLFSVSKIRSKPLKCIVHYTKIILEDVNKNIMVYSVKGSTHVKHNKQRNLSIIHINEYVILHFKQRSLS